MAEPVSGQAPVSDSDQNDPIVDKAVDDIVRGEADDELKAQDVAAVEPYIMKQTLNEKFKNFMAGWWGNPRRRWTTIAIIAVVITTLFTIPFTRYNILGLGLKAPVLVTVIDSKSGDPVSGAEVNFGGVHGETDAEGHAVLQVRAGSHALQVDKAYYTGSDQTELVTLSTSSNKFTAKLTATGRKVDIKLINKLTGQPVAGASVTVGGADAKTDVNGQVTLAVSSGADQQQATVILSGYNTTKAGITVGGNLSTNTFKITPTGKIYYLSGGNVMKADLDGSNQVTVLAVGSASIKDITEVKASPDWKYAAVHADQSSGSSLVYVIDTTNNDKLLTVDTSNAASSVTGWVGDALVYYVSRQDISPWQTGRVSLKSYDPATGQILPLTQSQGSGTSSGDYTDQAPVDPAILGDSVVYGKIWSSGTAGSLNGKQAELDSIDLAGGNARVIKAFTPVDSTGTSITMALLQYGPNALYVSAPDGMFYDYNNSNIVPTTSVDGTTFANSTLPGSNAEPTYYISPSGNETLWEDTGNESGTIFTGDGNGKNAKPVNGTSGYTPYGWFTDNYVLVTKHSQLYILSVGGGTPQLIGDYDSIIG